MRGETARSPVVHEEVECTWSRHPNDCRLHRQRLLTYSASLKPRICTSCLSFTAGEIPASNFLARRAARRRAHHNHRLANLCTSNMAAAVVGARSTDVAVSSAALSQQHGDGPRCCQQLFSNTQIFLCRFYIFFLPSSFFRSCISILFHASSSSPLSPLLLFVCSTCQLARRLHSFSVITTR